MDDSVQRAGVQRCAFLNLSARWLLSAERSLPTDIRFRVCREGIQRDLSRSEGNYPSWHVWGAGEQVTRLRIFMTHQIRDCRYRRDIRSHLQALKSRMTGSSSLRRTTLSCEENFTERKFYTWASQLCSPWTLTLTGTLAHTLRGNHERCYATGDALH